MSLSATFDKRFLSRYVVELKFGADKKPVQAIIDTACSTTLAPLWFAKLNGKRLNHRAEITVGGHSYRAALYLFENASFGGFGITKLAAFAAEYKGSIADRILLGNNVLHNFAIELHRNDDGRLRFEYRPWSLVKDKKHPCAMFFKSRDASPVYPSELMGEESAR